MAMMFHDGFDWLGVQSGLVSTQLTSYRGYSSASASAGAGRTGSGTSIANGTFTYTFPSAQTEVVVGFAYNGTAVGSVGVVQFHQSGSNQLALAFNHATGIVEVRRGNAVGTLIEATAAGVFVPNTWAYWEIKVLFSQTVGAYEVRRNGATVLDGTGVDTCNTATAEATSVALTVTGATGLDDWYALNTSGAANNDFLGDVSSVSLAPDADGTQEDWTLSAGADSYALVDDAPADADSTYIETATNGHATRFSHADVGSGDQVLCVTQAAVARKTDAGAASLRFVQLVDGSGYAGATETLGATYFGYSHLMETDPDTGSAWTPAGLNASEFGVEGVF